MKYPIFYLKNETSNSTSIIREGSDRVCVSYNTDKPIKYFLSEEEAMSFFNEIKDNLSIGGKWKLIKIDETKKDIC